MTQLPGECRPDSHRPAARAGHIIRGTGILNNELYIGKRVWNRLHYVKDPTTGRRRSRLNPPELWIVEEVPDLRMIDDELWDAVKVRQTSIRESEGVSKARETRLWERRRAQQLLHRAGPLRQLWQPYGLGRQGLPRLLGGPGHPSGSTRTSPRSTGPRSAGCTALPQEAACSVKVVAGACNRRHFQPRYDW